MREKLIELVAQVQDCGCDVTDVVEMNYVENDVLVDHLIANEVTIQKWISVKDRLPNVRQRILVYCESKTIEKHITACTYMGGLYGKPQFSRHVRKVTHWMPMPEPPKEENDG